MVFFSVPYDDGWSAQVNGQDVDIVKVDFGFMAVPCEEGENSIHFTYKTKYLNLGLVLTGSGFVVWTGYVVYFKRRERLAQGKADNGDDDAQPDDTDDTGDTDGTAEAEVPENAEDTAESEEEDVLKGN